MLSLEQNRKALGHFPIQQKNQHRNGEERALGKNTNHLLSLYDTIFGINLAENILPYQYYQSARLSPISVFDIAKNMHNQNQFTTSFLWLTL